MGLPARVEDTEHAAEVARRSSLPSTLRAVPSPTPYTVFRTLAAAGEPRSRRGGSWTRAVSLAVHGVLIGSMVVLPIVLDDVLPDPDRTVRAFFVSPTGIAPPPPPPPPPAAGARKVANAPAVPRPAEPPRFVAPVEVPDVIAPEAGIDLGVAGGVEGGVEGGVPGGVLGGIVGGLPAEAPPVEPTYVRIGGNIKAPKLVHRVPPEYPMLAQQARVKGIVILEARVDAKGLVTSVDVLQGNPLLDDAAVAAVRQWRYQPLLLNGEPRPFVLSVTISFAFAPL